PEAVAIGPCGDLFVSNWPDSDPMRTAAVLHFGAGMSFSDYAITGPKTGVTYPVGVAIDDEGWLLVANAFGGVVGVFAPGATGDTVPQRSFTAATGSTRAIACGARLLALSGACVCLYADAAGRGATAGAG